MKDLDDVTKWVKFSGASWYKNGFYYSRFPIAKDGGELSEKNVFHSVYYHELGTNQSEDKLIFRDAETFSTNGLAPVKQNKLWGFIDKTGKTVIPAEYQITAGGLSLFSKNPIKGFHHGVARVKKGNKWGFIDENGNPIGGKWYQNAELFVNTEK